MRKHTEKNPGLVRRILNWIEDMLNRVRGINDPEVERLKQARELYRKCLETADNNAEDVRDRLTYEEANEAYAGKEIGATKELFDYDFLTNLPDMQIVQAEERRLPPKSMKDGAKVAETAIKHASVIGSMNEDGSVSVKNKYTGRDILLTKGATRHSLNRESTGASAANAVASVYAGELLRDAVPLNGLANTSNVAKSTYALVGFVDMGTKKQVAVLTIETRSNSVVGMDTYDITHAINTRKWNGAGPTSQGVSPIRRSTEISIADFLDIVKQTHQSLLSDEVLTHYGEKKNPDGHYSQLTNNGERRAKFRFVDDATAARFEEANKVNDATAIDNMYMEAVNNGDYDTLDAMVNSRAEYLRAEVFAQTDVPTYKIRRGAEPKKTIKVYKTFTMSKEGNPTALFVSSQYDLPVGVWLDAQDTFHFTDQSNGHMYVPSTKNPNTKGGATGRQTLLKNVSEEDLAELEKRGYIKRGQNGEYTAKNLTSLAYRPGWHAGDLPFFPQDGMKIDGSNYENVHRYLFVPYGASPDGLFAFLRGTPPLLYKRRFIGYNDRRKWQSTLL